MSLSIVLDAPPATLMPWLIIDGPFSILEFLVLSIEVELMSLI